jgi:hypothetical protein
MDEVEAMTMIKRARFLGAAAALGLLAVQASGLQSAQMSETVRREGEKVIRALNRIEAESLKRTSESPRRLEFTESEFNSYIAYRIAEEREEVMRSLQLRLFADNRIEGQVFIDLSGQRLPGGLKPKMRLNFEAVVRTENGRIKVDLQKLFLEGQVVPIPLFDAIIAFAAAIGKSDPGSFNDWYELPYGLKSLRTEPGRVLVTY